MSMAAIIHSVINGLSSSILNQHMTIHEKIYRQNGFDLKSLNTLQESWIEHH